ncbi:MAG TPA: hypothetical protein EYP56_17300, partial [Planctomycetaceae bacterium]|nr:hypothetical protein [Planctomycetaceae bacterium]
MFDPHKRLQHESTASVPGAPVTYDMVPQTGTSGKNQFRVVLGLVSAALRRHWKVVVPLCVVLSLIAGATVYYTFTPKYRATAWLQMHDVAPYVAFPHRHDSRRFLATQTELMRTPLVLGPVISRPEIAEILKTENRKQGDPIQWLARQIQVRGVGQSELFTVAFEGLDPTGAAKVVNAVLDSYLSLREQEDYQQSLTVLEVLDGEMERRAAKIKRMRETVRELSKQLTGTDPYAATTPGAGTQTEIKYSVLSDLRSRLALAEVEQEVLKAEIAAYQKVVASKEIKVPETMLLRAVEGDQRVQQLEAALLAQKQRLREYEKKLAGGKDSPLYKRLANEVKTNEARLEELRKGLRVKLKDQIIQQLVAQRQDKVLAMEAQLEAYRVKKQLLEGRYQEELRTAKQFAGDTFELEMQREELAREQRVLDLIEDRAIQLRTELGAPARVRLLRRAEPPGSPVEDLPYKKLILAVLAGLLLPIGGAVGWEYISRHVGRPEELEEAFRVPVVGEVA